MSSLSKGKCWNCTSNLDAFDYGRQDTCKKCGKDTRVCKNCIHHDRTSHNECRENQADRVLEKEKSNFCDYFSPKDQSSGSGSPTKDQLKAAAEALFKKTK